MLLPVLVRLIILISLTLCAFAANSVLCRMALGSGAIDPVSFTSIRLTSALLFLIPLSLWIERKEQKRSAGWLHGSWKSGLALFIYALAFSIAYLWLSSGTGALILFGAVQITMLLSGFLKGERMSVFQWTGFAMALAGVVYLVYPGVEAPDIRGALIMLASGVAWSAYSIAGKSATQPVLSTSGNFIRAAAMAILISAVTLNNFNTSTHGIVLGVICGAITSGMGYVLWYSVLPKLSTTQASVLQLLVPLLASFGGVFLIHETISTRLMIASVLILGGVAFSVLLKSQASVARPSRS